MKKLLFVALLTQSLFLTSPSYAMEEGWVALEKDGGGVPSEPTGWLKWPQVPQSWGTTIETLRLGATAYWSALPTIEKMVNRQIGEIINQTYANLRKSLDEKDPLIRTFDAIEKMLHKKMDGENIEKIEKSFKGALRLVVASRQKKPNYFFKHIALFCAVHVFKIRGDKKESDLSLRDQNIIKLLKVKGKNMCAQRYFGFQKPYLEKLRGKAQVNTDRSIGSIAPDESEFIQKRITEKVKPAQKKYFSLGGDNKDDDCIHIGLAFSGGGYRAMTLTAGYMSALEELGLVDSSLYIAGLSGSTWYIAPWIMSEKSAQQYQTALANIISQPRANVIEQFVERVAQNDLPDDFVYDALLVKYFYDIPLSSVDLYGAFIAEALFPSSKHSMSLRGLMEIMKGSGYKAPFPIFAAISEQVVAGWYNWYEFNPFEVENLNLGFNISSWAFGRKFNEGVSDIFPHELSLGYLLGIFGSAYTVNIQGMIDQSRLPRGIPSEAIGLGLALWFPSIQKAIGETGRFYPAVAYNPLYKLPDAELKKIAGDITTLKEGVANQDKFTFVDAGINFNLPLLPLLKGQRELDIIIVGDSSVKELQEIDGKSYPAEMAKFIQTVEPWGIKYRKADIECLDVFIPEVTDNKIAQTFITRTVGGEGTVEPPIIVYFGFEKQSGFQFDPEKIESFWGTFNFKYTEAQFDLLSGLTHYTILKRQEVLKELLAYVYQLRRWRKSKEGSKPDFESMRNKINAIAREKKCEAFSRGVTTEQLIEKFDTTKSTFALFSKIAIEYGERWLGKDLIGAMREYAAKQPKSHFLELPSSAGRFLYATSLDEIMADPLIAGAQQTTVRDICHYVLGLGPEIAKWLLSDAEIESAAKREEARIDQLAISDEAKARAKAIIDKARKLLTGPDETAKRVPSSLPSKAEEE